MTDARATNPGSAGDLVTGRLIERPPEATLPVEHLGDLEVDLEPALVIPTPMGTRVTVIATGGRLSGPKLDAELLPGGGDWVLAGSDGLGRADVRATLRTGDGALIHFESRGLIELPIDGLERLAAGERLPFTETYVRTTPKFETGDERYAWLNGLVVIAYNELAPNHVDYRMYRVL